MSLEKSIPLMLTEIHESRATIAKLRKQIKAAARKLERFQWGEENGEGYFVGDVLDDLANRLHKMERCLPAEDEKKGGSK